MNNITTVCGETAANRLGFCQSHEHIFIAPGQSARVHRDLCIDNTLLSTAEMKAYRAAGGCAVVDAQPIGAGRDAEALRAISIESSVSIVASTGFHKLIFYPNGHWVFEWDTDRLCELYSSELSRGMYTKSDYAPPKEQTGIRAGFVKAALDVELSSCSKKLFTAAARAACQNGCALMVHIEAQSDPERLAEFLEEHIELNRVIFCHMDRAVENVGIHKKLCSMGISMEYDTIGRFKYHSDEREIEIIREMLDAGHEDRLLLGLDVTRGRLLSYGGEIGLTYIISSFIPNMEHNGISKDLIDKFFIHNPARVFAVKSAVRL